MIYTATYCFNVRRYIKREIQADSPEEAERIAKEKAWEDIDAAVADFANNRDDFGDTDRLDAYLMLDQTDAAGMIVEEICAEDLPDPDNPPPPPILIASEAWTCKRNGHHRGPCNSRCKPRKVDA